MGRNQANKVDAMVGICYRPPRQDEEEDKIFCKQLGVVSQFVAFVHVGDFSLLELEMQCSGQETV